MKHLALIISTLLVMSFVTGCGGSKTSKVTLPDGVSSDISVLSLGADTSSLNDDQIALLQQTINWMDKNIIQALNRKGFRAKHIENEKEFAAANNGHLLKISITSHKMIPKGARFLAGMMAGADVLGAHYELVDGSGRVVLSWDDSQGSTKGGTYCAQTLNNNTAEKIGSHLGG